jgi:hypothetical protein
MHVIQILAFPVVLLRPSCPELSADAGALVTAASEFQSLVQTSLHLKTRVQLGYTTNTDEKPGLQQYVTADDSRLAVWF